MENSYLYYRSMVIYVVQNEGSNRYFTYIFWSGRRANNRIKFVSTNKV